MKLRFLLLLLVATVAGCSSTGAIDGPVLTSPAELLGPSGGMAAEVTGVLLFEESTNCLLMELESVRYPLVWPAGTRWQEDPPAVVLVDGGKVEPGMTVYGGGGYLYHDDVAELSGPAVAAAAERCSGPTGEIAFFNIESAVDVTPAEQDEWSAPQPPDEFASGLTIGFIPEGFTFVWNEGHETAVFHVFQTEDGSAQVSIGRQISPEPYPEPGEQIVRDDREFTLVEGMRETRVLEEVAGDIRVEVVSRTLDCKTLLRIAETVVYHPDRDN